MPRRRTFNRSGNILDAPAGVDPTSWANDTLLTKATPPPSPPLCHCPPADPKRIRLGGCKPALRWVSHDQLAPYCACCLKSLQSGVHRRRDQLRMIALSVLDIEHLDLDDLRDWGVLTGDRPEPEAPDPAMAWPAAAVAAAARGPVVPDAEAIAAAAAALEQAEAQQAWLEEVSA